jgi:hypothetical protein
VIKYDKPVVGLGEKETAIIKFGREMLGPRKVSFGTVDSATFAEVLRLFDRKGTVDVVHLMASYAADAAELTAFDQHLKDKNRCSLPDRFFPRKGRSQSACCGATCKWPERFLSHNRTKLLIPEGENRACNRS